MSKRILFVDDEPMVLKGLERSLRGMRNEWQMQFVTGGPEALAAMELGPFDVVISDMRMPGMDGAQLLDQVRKRFSQTVRMVLSGQSDKDAVLRSIRPTHQYLSKPCDIEELKQKLKCALGLQDVLQSSELKQKVSQIENVPSLPSFFQALQRQLQSVQPDLQEVANIVSHDPGMSAKLLQLVNSAFLGRASQLSCPRKAVSIIGLDNLRSLASSGGAFSELSAQAAERISLLWRHSYRSGCFAEAIALCEGGSDEVARTCFAAGLLHDIGWIVLASSYGDKFEPVHSGIDSDLGAAAGEHQPLGHTHALVGAYLLGLWGLSDPVVEAVAGHHAPGNLNPTEFCPLLAVHVAEHWEREWHGGLGFAEDDSIDTDLLAQFGLLEHLPVWEMKCREIS